MILGRLSKRWTCMRILTQDVSTHAEATPRITIPHRMIQQLEKIKLKASSKLRQQQRSYKGPLIISCKRSSYNHYHGQTYSDFNVKHLASHAWKHPGSKGDYFTINAYRENPALDVEGESLNFSDYGLSQEIVDTLAVNNIITPTKIQSLAIPIMLQRSNIICASETGSGKTLAYLLPILEWLRRTNQTYGQATTPNQPYGVIVVPSRELAFQIHSVANLVGQAIGCRTKLLVGGRMTQKVFKYQTMTEVDLLISTPGVLSKVLTNRFYDMSRLSHLILDEADTLFDDSFSDMTLRLIRKMNVCSERIDYGLDVQSIGTQLALVSATMPTSLDVLLKDIVPIETIEKVTTPHLHRIMPHVAQKFVRLGPAQRPEALMTIIKKNVSRKIPTLVFCNTAATSYYLGHLMTETDVPYEILNGDMPQKARLGRFERFQAGECNVLISTDAASRGLDTHRARLVINYEFPNFMSDYIHRVGRVGRVTSTGTNSTVSFITYKWDVDLLWKIEVAARRVTELNNVNANIKRKLVGIAEKRSVDTLARQNIDVQ